MKMVPACMPVDIGLFVEIYRLLLESVSGKQPVMPEEDMQRASNILDQCACLLVTLHNQLPEK